MMSTMCMPVYTHGVYIADLFSEISRSTRPTESGTESLFMKVAYISQATFVQVTAFLYHQLQSAESYITLHED